ncbi:eotaxin-like [Brachyhypopomus gauderio]|uniref:eotaxin-like n=1 Tax=Brachyhypopomus gauderio TaxID=698409 RepID=UPI0040436AB6
MNVSSAPRSSSALLLLLVLSSFTLNGSEARPSRCCLKTSDTKIQLKLLKRYVLQENALCPLTVIRFITVKETTICSDPSSPWAIKAKEYLDRKQREGASLQTPTERPRQQSFSTNRTRLQV